MAHNLGSTAVYAVAGTLISVGVVFGCVYSFAQAVELPYMINDILLFSALISATDPVATLSVASIQLPITVNAL